MEGNSSVSASFGFGKTDATKKMRILNLKLNQIFLALSP